MINSLIALGGVIMVLSMLLIMLFVTGKFKSQKVTIERLTMADVELLTRGDRIVYHLDVYSEDRIGTVISNIKHNCTLIIAADRGVKTICVDYSRVKKILN